MSEPVVNTFVIVPTVDLTDTMIAASLNILQTIRQSVDGSKSLLKFPGISCPDVCAGYVKYRYSEIIVILQEAEWTEEP